MLIVAENVWENQGFLKTDHRLLCTYIFSCQSNLSSRQLQSIRRKLVDSQLLLRQQITDRSWTYHLVNEKAHTLVHSWLILSRYLTDIATDSSTEAWQNRNVRPMHENKPWFGNWSIQYQPLQICVTARNSVYHESVDRYLVAKRIALGTGLD